MKQIQKLFLPAIAVMFVQASFAQMDKTVMAGGAAMYPSKNIAENAVNSKDHTTLAAAVKAADPVATLQSDGPFTVFASTNSAFNMLPAGTVDHLLMASSKPALTTVLTYHVVAGKYNAIDIARLIKAGNGIDELKTVAGKCIRIMMKGKKIAIQDESDGVAYITIKDVDQSNGVIHVIDDVLLPNM